MRETGDLEEDASVLEWFVRARGTASKVDDEAPLLRQARALRAWARGDRQQAIGATRSLASGHRLRAGSVAGVLDVACARLTAFAIRRIEGAWRDGALERLIISNNFVTRELGSRDDSDASRAAMPAGFGTLLTASECARLGGLELVIHGSGSKALDVRWVASNGGKLRIEAKARAFAAGFDRDLSAEELASEVMTRVRAASAGWRQHRTVFDIGTAGALDVAAVTCFAPPKLLASLAALPWPRALGLILRDVELASLPQVVMIRTVAVDDEDDAIRPIEHVHSIEVANAPRPSIASVAAFHAMNRKPIGASTVLS